MSKQNKENPYLDIYRKRMERIEFMTPYLDEVNSIFTPSSPLCKQFLIDSFTYLDSYLHYLSFTSKDEIDKELLKAAQILQIHPQLIKKDKIFEGLDAREQHNFWMRFFTHFDLKQENKDDSFQIYTLNSAKPKLLNNVTEALNYFNYEFQCINPKKINKLDVKSEIEKWEGLEPPEEVIADLTVELPEINIAEDVNIDKPIDDVKSLTLKYDLLNLKSCEKNEKCETFFKNFKGMAGDVVEYSENVKKIDSFFKKNVLNDLSVTNDDFSLSNLNQVKRCQELVKRIESKRLS